MLTDFQFYLQTETNLSDKTIKRHIQTLEKLIKSGLINSREEFLKYCLKRIENGIDPYTINKEIQGLNHYLTFKKKKWQKIHYFKTKVKNKLSPTLEEIEKFLAVHTTDHFDVFWQIHINSGTRPGEVINLKVKDIDFNNSCFYPEQTKTDDGKPIILLPHIKKILQDYIATLDKPIFLFESKFKKGSPITVEAINRDCQKRLKAINCQLPYTPHSFRHAYITIGISKGVPIQYIQRTTRHADIKTTMNYFDKNVDFAKKAAYSHPFYKNQLTADEIIEDWISYITKTKTNQFNNAKLQQAFSLLYESKKPPPKER